MDEDISSKVFFDDLVAVFEKIIKSPRSEKIEILRNYVDSFKNFQSNFRKKASTRSQFSFFSILRLIIPNADNKRHSYGIKTAAMGKLFVRILAIDPNGPVGKTLTNPADDNRKTAKDFADTVFDVIKFRSAGTDKGKMTVFEVNRHLDNIAEYYESNQRNQIENEFIKMLNGMHPLSQKWIIRIILKKLNFGLRDQQILNLFHPQADQIYAQKNCLSEMCKIIECNDNPVLIEVIEPFYFVRPMLCERINISNIQDRLAKQEFYLEKKYDGERFQIHVHAGKFEYFSRNGINYTTSFQRGHNEEPLTYFLRSQLKIDLNSSLIIDGEMMVWNLQEQIFHSKGENFDVKNLKVSHLRPCFCAYDIMYFNGKSLLHTPYIQRIELLNTLLIERLGHIVLSKSVKIQDSEHFLACLNDAIESNEEGVVIKASDSIYCPGKRNAGWCKIKPDYINGVVSDFDLLIIGGFLNSTKTNISKFMLGVMDETPNGRKFYSVATVRLGLKYSEWKSLNSALQPYWQSVKVNKIGRSCQAINPPMIEFGSIYPDHWIEPEHSIILEVKAAELSQSTSFRSAYTLRFPRIVSIRSDKIWKDCCTVLEFEQFYKGTSSVKKIVKRQVDMSDINLPIATRKPRKISALRMPLTAENDIAIIDSLFEGLEFCILSSLPEKPSVQELKKFVLSRGGQITENPNTDTFVCIAGHQSLKVKRIINTGKFNVAFVDWLIKFMTSDGITTDSLQFCPLDMICCTEKMHADFIIRFDKYGDSYTVNNSIVNLKTIIAGINNSMLPALITSEIRSLEIEMESTSQLKNMFRGYISFFLPVVSNEANDYCLSKLLFKARGGTCTEDLERYLKNMAFVYIISPTLCLDDLFLNEWLHKLTNLSKFHILNYKWIIKCIEEHKIVSYKNFVISL